MILAIDPGNKKSAFVLYEAEAERLVQFEIMPNDKMIAMIAAWRPRPIVDHLAIEMVASYGMAVGREVFDTCVWIGRYIQAWGGAYTRVYRAEVKMHLCHRTSAKDANVRQALLDRFGPGKDVAVGTKKQPGPLYGVSADVWAALAVAVTYADGAAQRDVHDRAVEAA